MSDITLKWNGDKVKQQLAAVAEEVVWLAAQDAIRESTNNVPLDTGTLRRSGVVTLGELPNAKEVYEGAEGGKSGKEYSESHRKTALGEDAVAYASYNTPYAVHLHEDTSWKPRSVGKSGREKPAVGGPKWLEKSCIVVSKRWNIYAKRARRKAGL